MSAPCSNATPDDEIMALFARDLETADDPGTVIRDYCAGHPSLAEEIRALAAMMQKVDRSRPEPAVQQPTQLGEFRILRRIDHGGQGEIYEAVQERLHRRVAVKIIRRGRISSDARARFLREQQVLAQLHQTHIVPIHMAGEEGSLQYFVMPYIEGAALHNVVRAARLHEPGRQGSKTPTLAELAGMVAGDDKNGGATQDFSPESS